MANPRQRRKQRSSTHKAVSHSRHAKRNLKKTKPIRGPKALQEAWDKTKTVRQNYAQLGLVVTLDPSASGGIEKQLGLDSTMSTSPEKASNSSIPVDVTDVPSGFGRILRDAAGNVLGFQLNDPEAQESSVQALDMEEDLESRMDQNLRQKWSANFSTSTAPHFGPRDESLVKNLERISATATGSTTLSIPISGTGSRHSSSGEQKYLRALIAKYGDNVELMARDLKLNPEQRTVGQLRRALRKLD